MKKIILFLFILTLAISNVNAEPIENYNGVQYLEMALSISSNVDIEYTSGSHSVDFIKSELSFFPRSSDSQNVKQLDAFANPDASIQQGSEVIKYTWSEDDALRLTYGYDAIVRVENSITRLDEKSST